MKIKILGTGCRKCNKLEENTKRAVAELGVDASIEKVEEIKKIVEYGVMSTPALVVDEEVKFSGRVPNVEEIKKHL